MSTLHTRLVQGLLLALLVPCIGHASEDPLTSYRDYLEVTPGELTIPMVLEVPLPPTANQVLVYEQSTGAYLESTIAEKSIPSGVTYSLVSQSSTDGMRGDGKDLLDDNFQTALDLLVVGNNTQAETSFQLSASSQVNVSELTIDYAPNSALPQTVTIFAPTPEGEELVVRKSNYETRRIIFPERFAQNWRIVFTYNQPVRISNIAFGPVAYRTEIDMVRFLAQPGMTYRVYLHPEKPVGVPLRAGGAVVGVPSMTPAYVSAVQENPTFKLDDSDVDGVPDVRDNCPVNYNPDQKNTRGTVKGDVCDDFDNDGVVNTQDNCEFIPNYDQLDTDADMIGDMCDKSESRLTEQYPWLPWAGMGVTFLVIVGLFISVARQPLPQAEAVGAESDEPKG